MTDARSPAAEYLRFLMWASAAAAALALLGWVPTRRLAGSEGLPALVAGCAVGLLASLVGGIPVALGRRAGPGAGYQMTMASMAVRLAVVAALGLAAALSGAFEIAPLLLWVAISYMGLLVVDTWYAVKGF
jgi:hypothetical protein